jgi:hypothetical protein
LESAQRRADLHTGEAVPFQVSPFHNQEVVLDEIQEVVHKLCAGRVRMKILDEL